MAYFAADNCLSVDEDADVADEDDAGVDGNLSVIFKGGIPTPNNPFAALDSAPVAEVVFTALTVPGTGRPDIPFMIPFMKPPIPMPPPVAPCSHSSAAVCADVEDVAVK